MNLSRDLEMIAKQEGELLFPEFDEEIAWRLGSRLRELASARRLPVAIEVKRFGQPLFYSALNGSTPDNSEWVRRKGNVVARFHRSSYAIGLILKETNSTLADKFDCYLLCSYNLDLHSFLSHFDNISVNSLCIFN